MQGGAVYVQTMFLKVEMLCKNVRPEDTVSADFSTFHLSISEEFGPMIDFIFAFQDAEANCVHQQFSEVYESQSFCDLVPFEGSKVMQRFCRR